MLCLLRMGYVDQGFFRGLVTIVLTRLLISLDYVYITVSVHNQAFGTFLVVLE